MRSMVEGRSCLALRNDEPHHGSQIIQNVRCWDPHHGKAGRLKIPLSQRIDAGLIAAPMRFAIHFDQKTRR